MVDKSKKDNAKARLQIYGRVDLILNGRHWTGAVIANKTLPGMKLLHITQLWSQDDLFHAGLWR